MYIDIQKTFNLNNIAIFKINRIWDKLSSKQIQIPEISNCPAKNNPSFFINVA